jgi:hypothetical protein
MIRRTEITIETVEITTIRRTRPEAGEDTALRNEMTGTTVIGCAVALEQVKEYEAEEIRKNENTK